MAKLKRAALKAHKKKHRAWQKYAKAKLAKGEKPIKFKDYEPDTVYFGKVRRPTYETRMKAAGMTGKQRYSRRKKK